jgi:carotene biosynthesis associated membrane protein
MNGATTQPTTWTSRALALPAGLKATAILFVAHVIALLFSVTGLLVFMRNPALILSNPLITQSFPYGQRYGGMVYILLGAATLLTFGWVTLGARKTLIFFAVATLLPLTAELIGTSTGWPFGPYEYTDLLGLKVLGKVPFTIPLSWFYMGFTSYLLASVIISRIATRGRMWWKLALGAWLLMAWDLALDPAMVHNEIFSFWRWYTDGVYFGMPLQNFAGWWVVGFLFMGISRFFWREDAPDGLPVWLPFGMYLVNMVFAMALSLGAGLWQPLIIALALGIAPASLALWGRRGGRGGAQRPAPTPHERVAPTM